MSWMKTNQIQAVLVETVKGFWSHHGLVLTKPEKIGNSQNMISNDDEKTTVSHQWQKIIRPHGLKSTKTNFTV